MRRSPFSLLLLIHLLVTSGGIGAADDSTPQAQGNFEQVKLSEVLEEIDRIRAFPGAADVQDRGELSIWVNQLDLGAVNSFDSGTNFYLTCRIHVINQGAEAVVVESDKVTLSAWGQTYSIHDVSEQRGILTVLIGGEPESVRNIETPPEIEVAPGEAVAFWAVFTNLQRVPTIGAMKLELPVQDRPTITHNLRTEQESRLGLRSETLGAANSLGMLTIFGELNSINAQDLIDAIQQLIDSGTRRFLVRWESGADEVEENLLDWLLFTAANPGQTRSVYQFMPQLPEFEQLVCAEIPEENVPEFQFDDDYASVLFEHSEEAADEVLRPLYEVMGPRFIGEEIRTGHPLSRSAALHVLSSRRDTAAFQNLFPTLLRLYESGNESDRRNVLLAMSQQTDPRAWQLLTEVATQGNSRESIAAFQAMLRSNHYGMVREVRQLLSEDAFEIPLEQQIEILSANFRPEWTRFLAASFEDDNELVRAAALKSLVDVGHPRIMEILEKALADSSEDVRLIAFEALASRGDVVSNRIAHEYALEMLSEGKASASVMSIIEDNRDTRAATVIVDRINIDSSQRLQLINLLGTVGDDEDVRQLFPLYEEFTPDEQAALLNLVDQLELPEIVTMSKLALESEHQDVRRTGIAILTRLGSDEATETLYECLYEADPSELSIICAAIGQIGTMHARDLLREFRSEMYQEKNDEGLSAAHAGLYFWARNSPAWNSIDSAYYHSQMENSENALKYFQLAAEIDPELGTAFHGKGNALLKLKRFDESREAYKIALELDDFDGQAITGLGIVMAIQGETEAAVELALESIDKFPKDNVYYYNTACVYGRAIEYLRKQPQTKDVRETISQYEQAAIEKLRESIEFGFEEFDLMRKDPDIDALREAPGFDSLIPN
ncbi:Tetratricopeptide repeat protein [Thalassoglobus neptunius]|uniref:Tetratricopeptide repeat protein n=1 Tax=Thalassoglobus neptunius TaxID=1938619 RepID=A0A5C5X430_9PLAN|nr:HEAT repeat domain-containing protein [Thalassoglobus neptunius]TWT56983.1 Tetratricopeptide repeat protein [Thalassoglobus neptunius]